APCAVGCRRPSLRGELPLFPAFFLYESPDLIGVGKKPGLAFDIERARARQIDVDALADGAGAGTEDEHAIGEVYGFVDLVGDEQRRLFGGLPDPEQLELHE